MKPRRESLQALVLAAAAAIVVGCSSDEVIRRAQGEKTPIGFDPALAQDGSRTALVDAVSGIDPAWNIYVSCYSHKPSDVTDGGYYFRHQPFAIDNGDSKYKGLYYWLESGDQYDFYAYLHGANTTLTPDFTESAPKVSFEVSSDASKHEDVMFSRATQPDDYKQSVGLSFKHMLTAIRFNAATDCDPIVIKSLSISGVNTRGTFIHDGDWTDWTGKWPSSSLSGRDKTLTFTPAAPIAINSSSHDITPANQATFMMIPQQLPDGAMILLTFSFEGETIDHTVNATIAGEWVMGKKIAYTIKIKGQDITIQAEPWNYNDINMNQEGFSETLTT